jgi:Xaa-Pro aminopeptidase
MTTRLKVLQDNLRAQDVDALLITQIQNIRYLSDFTGDTGWMIISSAESLLCVDSRFTEQAEHETQGGSCKVLQLSGDVASWLLQTAAVGGISTLGFEPASVSFALYQSLSNNAHNHKIKLVPLKDIVESQRAIKDQSELQSISSAVKLADELYEYTISIAKPGITEAELAWQMEKYARENGSELIPFEFIVASGPNSAMPHARPSHRKIQAGEPITIDIGTRISGYCSDFTRTICLEKFDDTFRKIYDIVLAAQLNAIASIKPGLTGKEADATARLIIEKADYGKNFGHGLGHGLGLMIHELPGLGPMSTGILAEGMVFTVEPGVYLPGWGGVRIEDTVVLENGKVRTLSKANKVLNI